MLTFNIMSAYGIDTDYICGIDRYETASIIASKMQYSSVILVNGNSLAASVLKEPVVLVSDDSDKSIIAGANSATVLGNISEIAISRAKSYLYGDKVVFYVQHQDDETIFGGSIVIDAIKSVGSENVYMVLVTDGSGSKVFNYERYKGLTHEQKVNLRDNEFKAAIDILGVKLENVVFLNQPEDKINSELLKDIVLYFENTFNNVTHITHSYKYETHLQHIDTGNIVNSLYVNGLIKDCRFLAREDKISGILRHQLIESVADNTEEKKKVINACSEYKLDNKDMIREGIGYKSVSKLFIGLTSNPKVPAYLHESGI